MESAPKSPPPHVADLSCRQYRPAIHVALEVEQTGERHKIQIVRAPLYPLRHIH